MTQEKRLTRKQKRLLLQQGIELPEPNNTKLGMDLKNVYPLTENQKIAFDSYRSGKNLLLTGYAGTGKTYIATFLALKEVIDSDTPYTNILFIKSAEPSKNVGFLPGSLKDKTAILEAPFVDICIDLFGRGDAYQILKNKKTVNFMSTSYIRGMTFNDTIIIVDECQNLEWNELYAVITRVGRNTKIIFCGDYLQSDLKNNHPSSTRKQDILRFIEVLSDMEMFDKVEFQANDIVRSELVKQFIINSTQRGYM